MRYSIQSPAVTVISSRVKVPAEPRRCSFVIERLGTAGGGAADVVTGPEIVVVGATLDVAGRAGDPGAAGAPGDEGADVVTGVDVDAAEAVVVNVLATVVVPVVVVRVVVGVV